MAGYDFLVAETVRRMMAWESRALGCRCCSEYLWIADERWLFKLGIAARYHDSGTRELSSFMFVRITLADSSDEVLVAVLSTDFPASIQCSADFCGLWWHRLLCSTTVLLLLPR